LNAGAIVLRVTPRIGHQPSAPRVGGGGRRDLFEVVKVYGGSGIQRRSKGMDQRPGLDAHENSVNANEFSHGRVPCPWILGRSLTDLSAYARAFNDKSRRSVPSTTAGTSILRRLRQSDVSDALACLPIHRGIIRERSKRGSARAMGERYKLGRRRVKPSFEARILDLEANENGISRSAERSASAPSVVQRGFSKQEPWQTLIVLFPG